mmetsp:Transcript_7380/g.11013  ORF Transcript_7380/g.11013 Transcript_7380/m.11013 type:complete len:203 (+) Transcript_7380:43-651(+)
MSTNDYKIRTAEPSDAINLSSVINIAFEVDDVFKKPQCRGRISKDGTAALKMMRNNAEFLLVQCSSVERFGGIIGVSYIHWYHDGVHRLCPEDANRGPVGTFSMLSVLPEFSGKGLGKLLVDLSEKKSAERLKRFAPEKEQFIMEVPIVSPRKDVLEHFYGKLGYRMEEPRPFPEPGIILPSFDVSLIVFRKIIKFKSSIGK